MRTVRWREVGYSDASSCDECNKPFVSGEARLVGVDQNHAQFIIHKGCKVRWEKRTDSVDAERPR